MSGRLWFARDTGFTSDPKVQVMGDEYGPGGPLAIEEMLALAMLNDNCGSLSTSYASLARRAFITPAKAKRVVAGAVESGIIEFVEDGPKTFTARFLKWSRWQRTDRTAALRKSRQRSRESHGGEA